MRRGNGVETFELTNEAPSLSTNTGGGPPPKMHWLIQLLLLFKGNLYENTGPLSKSLCPYQMAVNICEQICQKRLEAG